VQRGKARYRILGSHASSAGEFAAYGFGNGVEADFLTILKLGAANIKTLLQKTAMDKAELKQVIPVNTNLGQWKALARLLRVPEKKFLLRFIAEGGHIGSVDLIRGLVELEREENLQKGEKILLYSQAIGLSFNSMLIEKTA